MSSMSRMSLLSLVLLPAFMTGAGAAPSAAQEARWDEQRDQLLASQPGPMARAVDRWEALTASENFSFDDYAGFLLTYPGFPREELLRARAEARLSQEAVAPDRLRGFFDRFPPQSSQAMGQYAVALVLANDAAADQWAVRAWRAGSMGATAEALLMAQKGSLFTQDDHAARMDALLWQGDLEAAQRQLAYLPAAGRMLFASRLSARQGSTPAVSDLTDPGFVYDRVRQLRSANRMGEAADLLATRPPLARPVTDSEAWVTQLLRVAQAAGPSRAVAIASRIDDAFAPGTDISEGSYRLRDDYTSLMWLGGTSALWDLGRAADAAPLFYRYGAAAQTPQTRSKGFYWAGRAASRAGDMAEANRYWEMAAAYRGQFYGLLAIEALGRDHRQIWSGEREATFSSDERARFYADPLVAATAEAARGRDWRTARYFFTHLADRAETPGELQLVADYARELGRRDFAVVIGEAAARNGFAAVQDEGFPTIEPEFGGNWTMIHAISRQESEFDTTRVSHAGARGLMQLMPGTAREQAGQLGMQYMSASLIGDEQYNIRLGDAFFRRMLDYYGGAYPLAVAAYNAGPGNVNRWLRANGDPRNGSIGYLEWIERIPFYETKNYVQRVIENAVVYEVLNPARVGYGEPQSVSWYLNNNR